jgi:hypothetical protein
MTLLALVLTRRHFDRGISKRLAYATLGLLFMNVSIGGTLTHFAAPPSPSWSFGWFDAMSVASSVHPVPIRRGSCRQMESMLLPSPARTMAGDEVDPRGPVGYPSG